VRFADRHSVWADGDVCVIGQPTHNSVEGHDPITIEMDQQP
jgi:hypothetical protein